jgi:hypothetical protein
MSSPVSVHSLRKNLGVNGFAPVAVQTGAKKPSGKGWTERARLIPPDAVTQWPDSSALSTGILCDGLVAVDVDIDDASLAGIVIQAAQHFLGAAPMRTRRDSSRALMLYRASEGEPSKRSMSGTRGKIEALGRGQMFVAFGTHPDGAAYEWTPCSPDTFSRAKLPAVSPDALSAFLEAVAPYIGAEAPVRPTSRPESSAALPSESQTISERDTAYAGKALESELAKLRALGPGSGRNAALNASAHSLGTLVGNGSIEASAVAYALLEVSRANGHVAKHGEEQTRKTIESGLNSGIVKPRPALPTIPAIPLDGLINAAKTANSAPVSKPSAKRSVALLQGSQIQETPITWLWDGYLPQGKLTLLAGAGGTGKSTLAFSIAATITTAGVWPDGTQCKQVGNVLIWSSEDDPADTIKPRLMAVGADDKRYGVISGTVDENGIRDAFDAARDMDSLREAVKSIGGIKLLIIDPIVTAVSGDMHKANDVRRSLQTIVDFAAEMNCAVLGITHFAKGTAGKNSAERVIGSQAFAALARMVLVAAKEEESDRRVFTRAKSNNSVDTGGFSYTIEALSLHRGIIATRVVWGEALEGSSRSILAQVEDDETEDTSQFSKAKMFLLAQLQHGPSPAKEIMEHARELHGISPKTCRRAKDELGITARKAGMSAGWLWQLPITGAGMSQASAVKPPALAIFDAARIDHLQSV